MNPDAIFVIAIDLCGSPERTNVQLAESRKGDSPMVMLILLDLRCHCRERRIPRKVCRQRIGELGAGSWKRTRRRWWRFKKPARGWSSVLEGKRGEPVASPQRASSVGGGSRGEPEASPRKAKVGGGG